MPLFIQKREIEDGYYQLRRLQGKLCQYSQYEPGELWEAFNRRSVIEFADLLTQSYFPRSRDLEIWQNTQQLYRLYLVLSPLLQRLKYSMRLDWHKGHLLTWLRRSCNRRVSRYWLGSWMEPRQVDPQRLTLNMRLLGIRDERFLAEAIDLFRRNYNQSGWRGDLANCVFDPIMLLGREKGYCIRVSNIFYRLEKKRFPGAIDLRSEWGIIWDYAVRFRVLKADRKLRLPSRGRMDIIMAAHRIREFKAEIRAIVSSKYKPENKVIRMRHAIQGFVEDAKFAKSAFNQIIGRPGSGIQGLKQYINQQVSQLKGTEVIAGVLGRMVSALWREKNTGDRYFLTKPNFFWKVDTSNPSKSVFIQFYNPKREYVSEYVGQARETQVVRLVPGRAKAAL